MVIAFALVLEIALVGAGGDQALVPQRKHPQQVPGIHGALDADGEGSAVRLLPDQKDVPAQVQDGALDASVQQQGLDLVRDIPLGEGPQIEAHAGARKIGGALGFVQDEVLHAQEPQGGGQLAFRGVVAPVPDIPQVDEGAHRGVQIPARALIHLLGEEQQLHGLGGYGHGLHPRGSLHPAKIAEGVIGVQQVIEPPYLLEGRVQVRLPSVIEGQSHHRVQQVVRALKGLWLGFATHASEKQQRQQQRDGLAHGRPLPSFHSCP